jgi:integrase
MQLHEHVAAGRHWRENKLIFPSRVGTPVDHSNFLKDFYRIIDLAGLPKIRFHDLRHSSASLMLDHRISPLIASKRLGHKHVSITLDTYIWTLDLGDAERG